MPTPAPPGDPADLLQRIPELEPLCADRWVRRAVASGNPLKVYRALFWAALEHWRGEPRISKRAVQVARQGSADGALLCAHLFLDRNDDWRAATAVLERRARAAGGERKAVEQAAWAARHVSAEEEQRILRAASASHPDDDAAARHTGAGSPSSPQ